MVEAPNRRVIGAPNPLVVLLAGTAGLVAVVVRFTTGSPLWLDEALSVNIASLPVGDIPEALRHDGHPPLYYLLLHWWIAAVGTGDVAVRALSGLLGVAALPLAWLAGRRVGGPALGWATAGVLAFSPYAVRYATETRMYALAMALVLVGWLLVRRVVDERRASPAVLVGVAAVAGALLLTHYWSIHLIASTAVVLLWWGRRAAGDGGRTARRLVVAMALGSLAFVPWVPSLLAQAGHTGTPWAPAARPTVVLDQTLRDLAGGTMRAETGVLAASIAALLLLGLFGRRPGDGGGWDGAGADRAGDPHAGGCARTRPDDGRRDDGPDDGRKPIVLDVRPAPAVVGEAAVALLTMVAGTVVGVVTSTTFQSRYAAVIVPFLAVLVGRALVLVPATVPRVAVTGFVAALAAMGIVGAVVDDRSQSLQLAATVAAHGDPAAGDRVVVCPDQLGPALRRALDDVALVAMPLLAYPTLGDGRFVDWYDYEARNDAADPAAVADAVLAGLPPGASLFVVWNGGYRTFEGDCEAFLGRVAAVLGPPRPLVPDGAAEFFEHAALVQFPPAAGPSPS